MPFLCALLLGSQRPRLNRLPAAWRRHAPALALLLGLALLGLTPHARAQEPTPGVAVPGSPAPAPPPGATSSGQVPPAREAAPPPGEAPPSTPEATGTPAQASAPAAAASSSSGPLAFFLVVVLSLFGYHLFTSFSLNGRIDRLEDLLRRSRLGAPEREGLVPFSWDTVLRSLDSGLPFLPGVPLPRPGLVLLGVDTPELGRALLTRVAWTVLKDPELAVVAITRSMGPDELGRRLLSLEAGRDWSTLGAEERQALLGRSARTLERYERSLFTLTDLALTPRQLFGACQEILAEAELGGLLVDGLEVLAPEGGEAFDPVDHLRLLAARCHVPVFLAVPRESDTWRQRAGSARFLAVAEVTEQAGEGTAVAFERFPGTLPAETLLLERASSAPVEAGA